MATASDDRDSVPIAREWRFIPPEKPPRARRVRAPRDPSRPSRLRWLTAPFARLGDNLGDPATRVGTVLVLLAALAVAAFGAYWATLVADLPSPEDVRQARFARASVLYTRYTDNDLRDEIEITRYSAENREWVPLDSISPYVVSALVATEDHRYFRHSGIDFLRLGSSLVKTALGDPQGGSTVTMQFARNAFPDLADDFTLTRKLKEWVIAYALEGVHDKRAILEMYLNTVPFLYNAFGVEAAARTYFSKSAKDLTVDEAATLVGMLKGASYYNPVDRENVPERIRRPLALDQTDRSRERRNVVLGQMVAHRAVLEAYSREIPYLTGFEPVTADFLDTLAARPTALRFKPLALEDRFAPFLADRVDDQLRQWIAAKYGDDEFNLYTAGLRIYTTLDPAMQRAAETALEAQSRSLQRIADQQWAKRTYTDSTGTYSQDPVGRVLRERPELVDQFIRQSEAYGDLLRKGRTPDEVLDSLRGVEAFADSLRERMKTVEASFIAVEPATRFVRAYVGGRAFGDKQFDHAGQARRQPGSTFKAFVYAAALETGKFKPTSPIRDAYQCREPDGKTVWRPHSSGSNGGTFALRDALKWSKNAAAVNLMMSMGGKATATRGRGADRRSRWALPDCAGSIGPQRAAAVARRAGLRVDSSGPGNCVVPSLALGICETTLVALANGYASFADGGRYRAPLFIERIEDADGNVVATAAQIQADLGRADPGRYRPREVVPPKVAYDLIDMLRGVVRGGTGAAMNGYGIGGLDLAGKTGTTQHGSDGWFMLVHPNLVMGAWVGFDSPTISWKSDYYQQGSHTALPIVGGFVRRIRAVAPAVFDPDARFTKPGDPPRPKPAVRRDSSARAAPARPRPRAEEPAATPEVQEDAPTFETVPVAPLEEGGPPAVPAPAEEQRPPPTAPETTFVPRQSPAPRR